MDLTRALLFAIGMLMLPSSGFGLDLYWSSGATDLTFVSAVRCTLVVDAGAGLTRLPAEWQLVWAADSCSISPQLVASQGACSPGVAQVTQVAGPSRPSEVLAHLVEAEFCSQGAEPATTAWYVLDLPVGSRGILKVIALDPADPDSTDVLQSGEVTFNGGVDRALPPVVLRTTTEHLSTDYTVTLIGAGFSAAQGLKLVAPNSAWDSPLALEDPSDTRIVGRASLAAVVPACVVLLTSEEGEFAPSELPAEPEPMLSPLGSSCQLQFTENILQPEVIQPKDFAIVPGGWTPEGEYTFHLFYIRQNQIIQAGPPHGGPGATETNIGHAVSNDLITWTFDDVARDTAAIARRPGHFDSRHVWAPHIIRRGVTYYMFYTGVDDLNDQRMGLATSTDLFHWTQAENPIFDFTELPLLFQPKAPAFSLEAQFRDPFVMENPSVPGEWLMYFVSVPSNAPTTLEVGVASTTSSDFTGWVNAKPFPSTQVSGGQRAESPHVFRMKDKWWLWFTAQPNAPIVEAISTDGDPTDPTPSNWSGQRTINELIVDEFTHLPTNAYGYWKGTELLEISPVRDEYVLAAYNDQAVSISYSTVRTDHSNANGLLEEECQTNALGVPGRDPDPPNSPLRLMSGIPMRAHADFEVHLDATDHVRVSVRDAAGRTVRVLAEGSLPAGRTQLRWDGLDATGTRVGPGVYFATLQSRGARHVAKIPLIR